MAMCITYAGRIMDHALEVGLCSRIALELMLGLEDDGFDFYTDNNYISPHHLKK